VSAGRQSVYRGDALPLSAGKLRHGAVRERREVEARQTIVDDARARGRRHRARRPYRCCSARSDRNSVVLEHETDVAFLGEMAPSRCREWSRRTRRGPIKRPQPAISSGRVVLPGRSARQDNFAFLNHYRRPAGAAGVKSARALDLPLEDASS
jgi:hypothetical protein